MGQAQNGIWGNHWEEVAVWRFNINNDSGSGTSQRCLHMRQHRRRSCWCVHSVDTSGRATTTGDCLPPADTPVGRQQQIRKEPTWYEWGGRTEPRRELEIHAKEQCKAAGDCQAGVMWAYSFTGHFGGCAENSSESQGWTWEKRLQDIHFPHRMCTIYCFIFRNKEHLHLKKHPKKWNKHLNINP